MLCNAVWYLLLGTNILMPTYYQNQACLSTPPRSSSRHVGPPSFSNPSVHCYTMLAILASLCALVGTPEVALSSPSHSPSLTPASEKKPSILKRTSPLIFAIEKPLLCPRKWLLILGMFLLLLAKITSYPKTMSFTLLRFA